MEPHLAIRAARAADVPSIAEMMHAYMHETYRSSWHGSAEALSRDGFGRRFDMQVAAAPSGEVVALAAWQRIYDLHHCIAGGEVIDMYVLPRLRGRGVGPALICAVAAEVQMQGGLFVKGQAVDEQSVRKLYERVAVSNAVVDCTIGGRAFRRLASLAGSPVKSVASSLPDKSWNYQA